MFVIDHTLPKLEVSQAFAICIEGDKILVDNNLNIPQLPSTKLNEQAECYTVGTLNNTPCLTHSGTIEALSHLSWVPIHELAYTIDPASFDAIVAAKALLINHQHIQYCCQCSSPLSELQTDWKKQCLNCNIEHFPKMSPAVIVSIEKDDEILLVQSKRYIQDMYANVAGFVQAGETAEQAVHREVFEEVGLKIHNLKYFGSQHWPFPASFMIGFTAQYLSGDIVLEAEELSDGQWYKKTALPKIPSHHSLSGKLIHTLC